MNNEFLPPRGARHNTSIRPQTDIDWSKPDPSQSIFQTPEAIAAQEEQEAHPSSSGPIIGHHGAPKRSLKERLKAITKKQWIIIGIVAAMLLVGGGFALYNFVLKDDPKPVIIKKKEEKKAPPVPTTVPSTLTGLPVDPSINERSVTAVMIENSLDARPQSGLNEAGVVFEAIAEGGITRFLTLFQDTEPDYIGPVRSVRPYYVQWALGFDAPVAHVGGSADALALVRANKDLDQFFNPGPYWRVSTRVAPHNMYSSIPKLRQRSIEKGWSKSNYTGLARKPKEAPSPATTARTIDFNVSSARYNVHYDYDPATNNYLRSEGGAPHTDERTGAQINPKVVVALIVPQGRNGIYTTYNTLGNGAAFIFQDGIVTQGTWSKSSNASQFTFKDTSGAELKLNPGRTWFTVLGGADRVAYQP
ncbi:MAG TPA: DUF3048 domain-containing protein [Candidatus Saccharimonadales bacterium]|nr:DUF3048 domain-containing protein [Candidatus Saccharimonadales bacterium]